MPEADNRSLNYKDNRYGFHLSAVDQKAGVSPEFVHSQVAVPIKNLGSKAEKALSLRAEDPDYLLAVRLLAQCVTAVQSSLDNKTSQTPQVAEDTEVSENSYNPRRF